MTLTLNFKDRSAFGESVCVLCIKKILKYIIRTEHKIKVLSIKLITGHRTRT